MDDAGTLARRLLQLPDPRDDAGALLLRQALWRQRETCGDGAATLAVIAEAMAHAALRARVAGAHPMLLRQGIEAAAAAAIAELHRRATPIPGGARGREMLRAVAASLCQDVDLRNALVEVIEVIGAEAGVLVQAYEGGGIVREFVEGSMFEGGWITPGFNAVPGKQLDRAEDVAVVVVHGKINHTQSIIQGLARIHAAGHKTVALVVDGLGDDGKQILTQIHHRGMIRILPLRITKAGPELMLAFQDLCVLTGASLLYGEDPTLADAAFAQISPQHIGSARRVWADDKRFGVIAGTRDAASIRAAIAQLRAKLAATSTTDTEELKALRLRLGRLNGGLGILRVGAFTQQAGEQRRDEANRLARALQTALACGVVAGGGAELARIGAALQPPADMGFDAALGYRLVADALAAPLRTIAENAGRDPSPVQVAVRKASSSTVFDARSGELRDMLAASVVDSVDVLVSVVQLAASVAAMSVTTDALVLRRQPPTSANP
jgi:chaperonin GroEL